MCKYLSSPIALAVFLLLTWALAVADSEADFERIRNDIWDELHFSLGAGDSKGISERRERLRHLFSNVPPEFAREFIDELGHSNTGGEFSQAFHGRLATPVRSEMLDILLFIEGSDFNVERSSDGKADHQSDNDLGQQSLFDKIDQVIEHLDPVRRERLTCMTSLLRNPTVDDQVILWSDICRSYNLISCNITNGIPVSQEKLHKFVVSEDSVVSAGTRLHFITNLRSTFERQFNFAGGGAENIIFITDQIIQTNFHLENMTTLPLGGGSMAPIAYRHIKSWVRSQQSNNNSVLSCFKH